MAEKVAVAAAVPVHVHLLTPALRTPTGTADVLLTVEIAGAAAADVVVVAVAVAEDAAAAINFNRYIFNLLVIGESQFFVFIHFVVVFSSIVYYLSSLTVISHLSSYHLLPSVKETVYLY